MALRTLVAVLAVLMSLGARAVAGQTNVAVAANFKLHRAGQANRCAV